MSEGIDCTSHALHLLDDDDGTVGRMRLAKRKIAIDKLILYLGFISFLNQCLFLLSFFLGAPLLRMEYTERYLQGVYLN